MTYSQIPIKPTLEDIQEEQDVYFIKDGNASYVGKVQFKANDEIFVRTQSESLYCVLFEDVLYITGNSVYIKTPWIGDIIAPQPKVDNPVTGEEIEVSHENLLPVI